MNTSILASLLKSIEPHLGSATSVLLAVNDNTPALFRQFVLHVAQYPHITQLEIKWRSELDQPYTLISTWLYIDTHFQRPSCSELYATECKLWAKEDLSLFVDIVKSHPELEWRVIFEGNVEVDMDLIQVLATAPITFVLYSHQSLEWTSQAVGFPKHAPVCYYFGQNRKGPLQLTDYVTTLEHWIGFNLVEIELHFTSNFATYEPILTKLTTLSTLHLAVGSLQPKMNNFAADFLMRGTGTQRLINLSTTPELRSRRQFLLNDHSLFELDELNLVLEYAQLDGKSFFAPEFNHPDVWLRILEAYPQRRLIVRESKPPKRVEPHMAQQWSNMIAKAPIYRYEHRPQSFMDDQPAAMMNFIIPAINSNANIRTANIPFAHLVWHWESRDTPTHYFVNPGYTEADITALLRYMSITHLCLVFPNAQVAKEYKPLLQSDYDKEIWTVPTPAFNLSTFIQINVSKAEITSLAQLGPFPALKTLIWNAITEPLASLYPVLQLLPALTTLHIGDLPMPSELEVKELIQALQHCHLLSELNFDGNLQTPMWSALLEQHYIPPMIATDPGFSRQLLPTYIQCQFTSLIRLNIRFESELEDILSAPHLFQNVREVSLEDCPANVVSHPSMLPTLRALTNLGRILIVDRDDLLELILTLLQSNLHVIRISFLLYQPFHLTEERCNTIEDFTNNNEKRNITLCALHPVLPPYKEWAAHYTLQKSSVD